MQARESDSASDASAELRQGLSRYRELTQREPVTTIGYIRDSLILLSGEEYHRLKKVGRRSFYPWELEEELIAALKKAEAPAGAAGFDHELTD